MLEITSVIGQEVFIIGPDTQLTSGGELRVFDDFGDVSDFLLNKDAKLTTDIRALHGILATAEIIPSNLRGSTIFIIIINPESRDEGILLESSADCGQELADEIKTIIKEPDEFTNFEYEIDDVFLLFGYEMSLVLTLDEKDISNKLMETSDAVYTDIEKLVEGAEDSL